MRLLDELESQPESSETGYLTGSNSVGPSVNCDPGAGDETGPGGPSTPDNQSGDEGDDGNANTANQADQSNQSNDAAPVLRQLSEEFTHLTLEYPLTDSSQDDNDQPDQPADTQGEQNNEVDPMDEDTGEESPSDEGITASDESTG
ncbi:uncharacterized protein DFL_008881 [Arthrobotrys flagrans]|uniref:Uncharacterized protein n=1 Tax=Arthrobotrys flagrans TaxID=97331 RepID=A0A436ZQ43_ARTFL|nr:hypothetical protein DFL_008881 [Arthrobotrys flagrans]